MRSLLSLIVLAGFASANCVEVSTDRIVAGDLFDVIPLFQTLDPSTEVGFAPTPGVQRILPPRELMLFAKRHGLAAKDGMLLPTVCVERATRSISAVDLKSVLFTSLGLPDATLEVIEYSSQRLAPGRLEFTLAGLNKPPVDAPESPVIWRGRLIYDGQRSASIWAKVKITIQTPCVISTEAIPAGTLVRAEQVKEVIAGRFPLSGAALDSAHAVVGKIARRNIPAGASLVASALEEPRVVNPGDRIRVKVIDGLASLSFEAVAESSGRTGDTILARNPSSGRSFRAVVEEKGRVSVQSSPGA